MVFIGRTKLTLLLVNDTQIEKLVGEIIAFLERNKRDEIGLFVLETDELYAKQESLKN